MSGGALLQSQKTGYGKWPAQIVNDFGMFHDSHNGDVPSLTQQSFLSVEPDTSCRHIQGMDKGRTQNSDTTTHLMKMTGERLRLLADLHKVGPSQFEKSLGWAHGHFRLIASGQRPLSIEKATEVCREFRVTLDWLYRGLVSSQVHPEVSANVAALKPELSNLPTVETTFPSRQKASRKSELVS